MLDRLRVASGVLCGLIIIAGLPAVTWASRAWLAASGWTPVVRNRIQWPSVMLLGPYGPLMAAVLLTSAAAGAFFVPRLRVVVSHRLGLALAVALACLAMVAVPPVDAPAAFPLVHVHNAAYLGLLAAWWVCVGVCWSEAGDAPSRQAGRLLAVLCAVPVLAGLVLALVPAAGQLARYLVLFPMAAWISGVAWLTRGADPC